MKIRDKFDFKSYVPWRFDKIGKVDGIIYKALNLINKNFYIGETAQTFGVRKSGHLKSARGKSQLYFHRALRKYPNESQWQWTIMAIYPQISENELGYLEMVAIGEMNPQYNMTKGGEGSTTLNLTSEMRYKLGSGNRGRKFSVESRNKMGKHRLGKKLGAKQTLAIIESNKERIWSLESRKRVSDSQKGKQKHTQEFKDYMRTVHLGKKVNRTEEHKKNLEAVKNKRVARIIDNQIVSVFPSARKAEKILKIRLRRNIKSGKMHLKSKSYFKYISHEEYEHLVTVLNLL
jgi:hypothetical protein